MKETRFLGRGHPVFPGRRNLVQELHGFKESGIFTENRLFVHVSHCGANVVFFGKVIDNLRSGPAVRWFTCPAHVLQDFVETQHPRL